MGGIGSGQHFRFCTKFTTETSREIDIRYLKRMGRLFPGSWGALHWSSRGKPDGKVQFFISNGSLFIAYQIRVLGREWETVQQEIFFDRTIPYFGGVRLWFLCPACDRRVVALYGSGRLFLCRHCNKLTYASQQERIADRMMRKARRLRNRLRAGASTGLIPRPKGMHRATYYRLLYDAQKYDHIGISTFLQRYEKNQGAEAGPFQAKRT